MVNYKYMRPDYEQNSIMSQQLIGEIEACRDPGSGKFLDQLPKPQETLLGTARHEQRHAWAVDDPNNVTKVTVEPGNGYLGMTELRWFDPNSAAANFGIDNGTGWDEILVEEYVRQNGENPETAKRSYKYRSEQRLKPYSGDDLNLTAMALCYEVTMTGTRNREVTDIAIRSSEFKNQFGIFPGEAYESIKSEKAQVIFSHQEHYKPINTLQ